ncbi:MAG TPA: carbonic anhydrase [Acidimicrobiales bacterium]|nr:carbonic anhydrase [Acidimicrobiales bacterium]
MGAIDDLLGNNARFIESFDGNSASVVPAKKVVVLTCMDSRLDPVSVLGLTPGDAHVLRNAGGIASDDAIRSIMLSQRRLGTTSIMVVHHTNCGMLDLDEQREKDAIEADTGIRPSFALEGFADLEADVIQTVARLEASPFIPHRGDIRGFVYEVDTGRVREVTG